MKLVSTCMCFGSRIEVSSTFIIYPLSVVTFQTCSLGQWRWMTITVLFVFIYDSVILAADLVSLYISLADAIDLDIMIVSSVYAVELSTVVPADGSRWMCDMACSSIVLPCGAFWKKTGTLDSVGHNCITSNTERHWILYNNRWPDDLWSYGLIEVLFQFLLEGLKKPMKHLSVLTELHKHA